MRGSLLALIVLAASLSGCITELTEGDGSTGSGEDVADGTPIGTDDEGNEIVEGQDLGEITFEDTGDAGVQGGSTACENEDVTNVNVGVVGGPGENTWNIPLTNSDGIGWRIDSITIQVFQETRGTVDMDLFVYGTDGTFLGRTYEVGPDDADGINELTFSDLPAGTYRMVVLNCGGVAVEYTVEGTAQMVATANPGHGGCIIESTSNGYKASRMETYQKELTGSTGTASISTGAGNVEYTAISGTTYTLVATLMARADSEDAACEKLARMYVDYRVENGAAVTMEIHGRSGNDNGNWNNQQIDLDIEAPAAIDWTSHDVDVSAGNIAVDGVQGTSVTQDVAAGNIDIDNVDADSLSIDASAGNILVDTTRAGDVSLDASAGNIIASFEASTQSGDWTFDVGAGNIDLTVTEAATIGYDVDARSSAGTVSFDFNNVETTKTDCQYASCHKEGRTNGYDSRSIKVTLDLDVSAGNIAAGS